MTVHMRAAIVAVLISLFQLALPAIAEEKFKLHSNNNIRRMLVYHYDQVVTLQTTSGKELTGTVTSVGEHLVHLSRLSGREYYDAAVDFDHIEAVILKVRSE